MADTPRDLEGRKKAEKEAKSGLSELSSDLRSGTPTPSSQTPVKKSSFTDPRNASLRFKKAYPDVYSQQSVESAPRYHVMRLHTGPKYDFIKVVFEVNKFNKVFPTFFDYIVDIQEYGSSSAVTYSLGGGNSTAIVKATWMFGQLNSSEIAAGYVTRTVTLTWFSGFTKEFTLSCSINGDLTSAVSWGSADMTRHFHVEDCTSDGVYSNAGAAHKFGNAIYYGQEVNAMTAPLSLYVGTELLSNPGILTDTEVVLRADIAPNKVSLTSNPGGSTHEASFAIDANPGLWTPIPTIASAQIVRFTTVPFSPTRKLLNPAGASYGEASDVVSMYPASYFSHPPVTPDNWIPYSTMGQNILYDPGEAFTVETARVLDSMFTQSIMYAQNIENCVDIIDPNVYDVCTDDGSPSYYITTCLDCDGNAIPPLECDGTIAATFISSNDCCVVPCDLLIDVVGTSPTTFGSTNGIVSWDAADPTGSSTPSGTPWASGSMYTVTLATVPPLSATIPTMPPAGGATFTATVTTNTTSGTEHQVAISSNNQISPGMQISVPSNTQIPAGTYVGDIVTGDLNNNVTVFELVDNVGGSVNALTIGTPTATMSAGFTGQIGALAASDGYGFIYVLKIVDDDGCVETVDFIIKEGDALEGCTDNDASTNGGVAINYESAAQIDDGSCFYCNINGDGQMTDSTGSISEDLFQYSSTTVSDATSNSATDGSIAVSFTMNNAASWFIELDGTQSYTIVLYNLSVPGDISTITSTQATQAGLAATTYTNNPFHTFSSLPFGYYAMKVSLVDNDEAHGLETCYTYAFANVMAPGCDDATANNYYTALVPTIPTNLLIPDNSLCTFPVACCTMGIIAEDITVLGTECAPYLSIEITCVPTAQTVWAEWQYNSGGGWTTCQQGPIGSVNSGTPQTIYLQDNSGANMIQGNGLYIVKLGITYANGETCDVDSAVYSYTAIICACTDPIAINYDALATIDDGSCIYESWDCISPGNCFDDGTGMGVWTSANGGYAACINSCLPVIPGCTDSCASNYDATATTDDGTCTYAACLDSFAYNQYWSCSCSQSLPTATVADPACCLFCASPTLTSTITDATGTCTSPLADGISSSVITLVTTANTFTVIYYLGGTFTVYYTDTNTYTNGDTFSYNAFLPGVYDIGITDNFGCSYTIEISVGVNSPGAGCTDATADNYDATATCDDGSCLSSGCTDPLATNYNSAATTDDGSCVYEVVVSNCIPPNLDVRLKEINICLSAKGSEWLAAYRIGTNADCTLMNKWKLILVQYLLQQKGLNCLYNCADESTPDISSMIACSDKAITGGPVTGNNDQGYAGSSYVVGGSTIITNPTLYFDAGNILYGGDVITMPSGLVWQVVPTIISCITGCLNPESGPGASSGNWTQCVPLNNITVTNNINYIDNFLNFANKFCQDCDIDLLSTDYTSIG